MSRRMDARKLGLSAALGCVLLLLILAAANLADAGRWQSALDRRQDLAIAAAALSPPLAAQQRENLHDHVAALIADHRAGFTLLAIRDTHGVLLATAGRFERWRLPLVSGQAMQRLRGRLYGLTGTAGELPLEHDGRPLGTLEYVHSSLFGQAARESSLSRLRWTSWLMLLLGLASIAALAQALRRGKPDSALWLRRLNWDRLPAAGSDPAQHAEAHIVGLARNRAGTALDALQRGMILVDAQARVLALNATAARLTGWLVTDAPGRLVFSVFHPLDERDAPLVTPVETCLREGRELPPTELRLRSRDGSVLPVEVMAALLRDPLGGQVDGAVMIFHDISERRAVIEQLRRQARLSQGVIDHLVEGVLTTDPAGVIRFANARALRMFGYAREDLDGVSVTKLMPVPFLNTPGVKLTDYVGGRVAGKQPRVVGWRKDATTFPVELQVAPMTLDQTDGLVLILRDISERLRSDNLSQRLGRLLDAAAEEVYIFDAQSLYFVEVNRGARRNLGYHPSEMTRMTPLQISQGLDAETFQGYLSRLRGGETESVSYRSRHLRADGSSYPVEVRLNFSREEEPPVFMAIASDISEREGAEERLRYLAHHDSLTGLPNRSVLHDRLRQAVLAAQRSSRQVGVLFIDLDRFKSINDAYGHDTGDRVLQIAAERLSAALRATDTVARIGGDEFVVVAQGLRSLQDAEALARKLIDAFQAPLDIPGFDLSVSPSIGISMYPLDETDEEGLLRHADAAMYQAKTAGRAQYRVYSIDVPPEKRRRMELERGIHVAVALNQYHLELTPVVDAGSGKVRAMLASFQWQHPRYGRIEAVEALAAAARAGLLADLELWLTYTACQQCRTAQLGELPVIIPISGWQLRDPDFSGHVLDLMDRHQVAPQRLIFALNVEGVNESRQPGFELLHRLLESGVRFALADHAANSFGLLNRGGVITLDLVMLEAAEVARINTDEPMAESLSRLVEIARSLDLPVIAAGVADAVTAEWLQQNACALLAGPVLQSALEPHAFASWLASQQIEPL